MNPPRRRTSAPLVVLLSLVTTVALVAAPAEAKPKKVRDADAPSSGYKLDATKKAAGGFLGARKIGDQVVYRIDPTKKTGTKAFQPTAAWTDTLIGSGKAPASQVATARAAWIVGKYGSYPSKKQNAAVEIALDDLLVGGSYALKGKATKARLAQVAPKARKAITKLAGQVLAGAETYASAYAVTLDNTPAVVRGDTVTSTVKVVATGTGAGVPNLAVTFAYPGSTGAVVRTDGNGVATATYAAGAEGVLTTSATIANVPENRLLVLSPTSAKYSRVVVADKKTDRVVTDTTAVSVGRPTLTVPGGVGYVNDAFASTLQVRGGNSGARTATATLLGPFATGGPANPAAVCSGPVVKRATVAVNGPGDYALPTSSVPLAGYYVWSVDLAGDTRNAGAQVCGGQVLEKARPQASVAPNTYSLRAGQSTPANVSAFGLPPNYTPSGEVTVFAWGPFFSNGPAPSCSGSFYTGSGVPVYVDANGTLGATNTRNAMTFANPGNPYGTPSSNYFFTVVFPADAYGRSDAFSTECLVYNGSIFTNGLNVHQ